MSARQESTSAIDLNGEIETIDVLATLLTAVAIADETTMVTTLS